MVVLKPWIVAGIAAIVPLLGSAPARADAVTQACLGYASRSDMIKAVPAPNRQKWCACIIDKFDPEDDETLMDVFEAQEDSESKGHAFSPSSLPPSQVRVGNKYANTLNQCISVLLGG